MEVIGSLMMVLCMARQESAEGGTAPKLCRAPEQCMKAAM